MREPRYRFSDAVRATTRAIALRMVHAGEVATTPDELAAWIDKTEDIRGSLTAGGYGTKFNAADLFPLVEGFVGKASKVAPQPVAAPSRRWRWIFVSAAALVILLIIWGVSRA